MKLGLTLFLPVIQGGYGMFVLPTLSSAVRGPDSHKSGRFLSHDMPVHRCLTWRLWLPPCHFGPGADEMGVPNRSCNPRERNWEPLPIPPMSRPPPRAPRVSPAPAALPARSQPQWRPPGAQLGPTPTQSHRNLDPRSPGLPSPGCAPGAFSASVSTSQSTTGKPAPTPARSRTPPHAARVRPAPARSRYLPSF